MALRNITPKSSSMFSVDVAEKMMIVEHSTLRPQYVQLYDDACDAGIAIRSERTGAITYWYFAEEIKDGEGDLQVTILKPVTETVRKFPHLEGWTVHVLNT